MRDTFWWWGLPLACGVMLAVLLGAERSAAVPEVGAGRGAPVSALAAEAGPVLVQDAAGRRSGPVHLPTAAAEAIVVRLPAACAAQRCRVALWRHEPGSAAVLQWRAEPRVRADGCLPIGGLAAGGCYDLEVQHGALGEVGVRRAVQVGAGSVVDWTEPAGSR